VVRVTAGDHATYEMTDFAPAGTFGSDKAVHWFGQSKPGDRIEFNVPVRKPGKYTVTLGLVKSWDYGIFQPMVDGKSVGKPFGPIQRQARRAVLPAASQRRNDSGDAQAHPAGHALRRG